MDILYVIKFKFKNFDIYMYFNEDIYLKKNCLYYIKKMGE